MQVRTFCSIPVTLTFYRKNAAHAGIDLEEADFLALSHFHRDHTRGLLYHPFESKKKLLLHPRVLTARYKSDDEQLHADYADIRTTLTDDFELIQTTDPVEFVEGAFFLGRNSTSELL